MTQKQKRRGPGGGPAAQKANACSTQEPSKTSTKSKQEILAPGKRGWWERAAEVKAVLKKSRVHAQEMISLWVKAGQLLIEQKDSPEIEHGDWLPFLAEVGIDEDKAARLMAIARHPVLSQNPHVRNLPPHYSTLAILSRLPEERLEQLIGDGTVHPDMERSDAEAIAWRDRLDRSAALPMHVEHVPDRSEPAPMRTAPVPTHASPAPIKTYREPEVTVLAKRDSSISFDDIIATVDAIINDAVKGEFDAGDLQKLSDDLIDRGSELLELVNRREEGGR
jgi:hypothetical protein